MHATKKIAKRLYDPSIDSETKQILSDLINALDRHEKIDVSRIFKLGYNDFELVTRLLVDWRLHQYRVPPGGLQQAILESIQETSLLH